MKGKVKWYDEIKGFGFIVTDDGKDIFVHRSGLKKSHLGLKEGQVVEFETKEGEKGPVAFNVE
ncbi:MAG: cold shock domain-containing protein [Prolixibacteraceae bacterium]|nr:cold shock domain-containing protein [Prolixibacteraceae bacterium]MBN2775605.1 cold shock domain-containing protein [Prolixibacteraceae bacterium]